jgi:mRNA-degrading endonuclease RelE of RelBE toxin-antitoxin system
MQNRVGLANESVKKKLTELKESTSEDQVILTAVERAIDQLHINVFCGIQIPERQIPDRYVKKYGLKNLWKLDMHNGWRLLYFIISDSDTVVAVIVDWMPHKEYDRLFHY